MNAIHGKNSKDEQWNEFYVRSRREMLPFIPEGAARVLEIGCGTGLFGESLKKERGAEVWGLEINSQYAQEASGKLDKVLCGDIEAVQEDLPDGYFNCVVFNDILEHLPDPGAVVNALKSKLASKGCYVCSIPNVRYFKMIINYVFHKDWQYTDHGILDRTHLRFFTKKSIIRFFRDLDLDLETIKGVNANHSLKFYLLNLLFLGSLGDSQHVQFACVARKRD